MKRLEACAAAAPVTKAHEDLRVLHRIVEIEIEGNETFYVTKGDNNRFEDSSRWTISEIEKKIVGVLY